MTVIKPSLTGEFASQSNDPFSVGEGKTNPDTVFFV